MITKDDLNFVEKIRKSMRFYTLVGMISILFFGITPIYIYNLSQKAHNKLNNNVIEHEKITIITEKEKILKTAILIQDEKLKDFTNYLTIIIIIALLGFGLSLSIMCFQNKYNYKKLLLIINNLKKEKEIN